MRIDYSERALSDLSETLRAPRGTTEYLNTTESARAPTSSRIAKRPGPCARPTDLATASKQRQYEVSFTLTYNSEHGSVRMEGRRRRTKETNMAKRRRALVSMAAPMASSEESDEFRRARLSLSI
jgi:hypothetical protein